MCNSGVMRRSQELGFDDDGRPILITAAAPSYEVQHRQRVRKYLTIMSFRIPALLLAAVAYGMWHNGLISLAIIAASIPLPWIAVLVANDRPPRRADEPRRFDEPTRRTPLFPTAERPVDRTSQSFSVATGMAARDAPTVPNNPTFVSGSQYILRAAGHSRTSAGVRSLPRGNYFDPMGRCTP